MRLVGLCLMILGLLGCGQQSKACQKAYSSQGTHEAIHDLVADFRATVALVRAHNNLILLSEAQSVAQRRDLGAMEEWTCRAQKLYGLPKDI